MSKPASGPLQLVPAVADPIPDTVLAHPLLGEARRFDGAAAPSNWMFAQGQTLNVADNRALFGVLGAVGGGNGKTTFKLPSAPFGLIVAVAGQLITSPNALAQSGRRMTASDSLGPSARALGPRPIPQPAAQTLAERRLSMSAIHPTGRVIPLSAELVSRIDRAEQDTRAGVLAALGSASRSRLDAALQAILGGQLTIAAGAAAMSAALTEAEADALVRTSDALTRQFNGLWPGNDRQNVQLDAAQFLFSIVITRDQARAIALQARRRR